MTDLFVEVFTRKTGRQITHLTFRYHEKTEYSYAMTMTLQEAQLSPTKRKKAREERGFDLNKLLSTGEKVPVEKG